MIEALLWAPEVTPFGGHKIQMAMTAHHLNQTGRVRATVAEGSEAEFRDVDVVHAFFPSRADVRRARNAGVSVVLSPIYWPKHFRHGLTQPRGLWEDVTVRVRAAGVLGSAALRGRHHAKAEGYVRWVVETTALYESVDMLLPNSESEAHDLTAELGVTTPQSVVPNGVDPARFAPATPRTRSGVLMAARVEPLKNQLGLIRALRGCGFSLTIVGGPNPDHGNYYSRCLREGSSWVTFLPSLSHDELAKLYAQSRVHVLPSYFETTGLVSLEAGLTGCQVVTTSRGYARDYFGDLAWYCEPTSGRSIRAAVTAAYGAQPDPRLQRRILERYTWTTTAEETATAYERVIGRRA